MPEEHETSDEGFAARAEVPTPAELDAAVEPPRRPGRSASSPGRAVSRQQDPLAEVEQRANEWLGRAAEKLDEAARAVEEIADRGARVDERFERAAHAARGAARRMDGAARYLRANDARALEGELERLTRERPLPMIVAAVAAGWLAGKALR